MTDFTFWLVLIGVMVVPVAAAYDIGYQKGYAKREKEQVEFEDRRKKRLGV